MAPRISQRHHGNKIGLIIQLGKQTFKHFNSRLGNHDHLGINRHASRIQGYGTVSCECALD